MLSLERVLVQKEGGVSKLKHPPAPCKPRAFELLKIDRSRSRLLGPKWSSNALPYRRINNYSSSPNGLLTQRP